jgi:hypothetical protein
MDGSEEERREQQTAACEERRAVTMNQGNSAIGIIGFGIALGLAACASPGDANREQVATRSEALLVEVPARSAALGAARWQMRADGDSFVTTGVDAVGHAVTTLRLGKDKAGTVTMQDVASGELVVIDSEGRIVESTMAAGSRLPVAITGLSGDVTAYEREHPEGMAMACEWLIARAWAACGSGVTLCLLAGSFTAGLTCGGGVVGCSYAIYNAQECLNGGPATSGGGSGSGSGGSTGRQPGESCNTGFDCASHTCEFNICS